MPIQGEWVKNYCIVEKKLNKMKIGRGTCIAFVNSGTFSESVVNIKPCMSTQVLIDTEDRYGRWGAAKETGYKAEHCQNA